jgi:hypothetical protein
MILSIHSSAAFQTDSGWPSFWPPVKLPPPSPLSQAASSLWSPKLAAPQGGADTAQTLDPAGSLYSVQLRQSGQTAPADTQGRFQMAFLDQRIALVRFDAGVAPDSLAA